ncbi:DUF506 family protein, partial [Trifolium medium]|nr:DUF506 family protein [Trifolium medium]
WLSASCTREIPSPTSAVYESKEDLSDGDSAASESDCGELELIFGEKTSSPESKSVAGGEKSFLTVAMPT